MDSDETTLQNALDVLRQHYGERLVGPQQSAEAQMRHTLEEQMGLDMLAADRVLTRLCLSGRLSYVDSTNTDTVVGTGTTDTAEPGTTATGPVISMPLTQSADGGQPLITTASPGMLMGVATERGGGVNRGPENTEDETLGWLVAPAVDAAPVPATTGEAEGAEGGRSQGYWRIG